MAELPLRISGLAQPHLERIRRYHHELGGDPRVHQLDRAIAQLLADICAFPGAYAIWHGTIRRIVSRRFHLAVYYRIHADHILVMLVTDQRQDPRRLRFTKS
ncbi:type II toxin-antitoxin system RelE/ParE family toxin [Nannocystis radixulma]|uniref:Type II toxin-antitoxin system RelE/ParE family toxin n=1 Tax=Nannocystis radixulma TaxID=2995305 RepID=A0ABT5B6V9_9BACT|nr:type II toxin-antitoxin system RelE/ParE family toxin [Nannocystis radixulma]MDC0669855.1 type II toxin-antitoxin system RelE/ParE family toxin [Nannocystis radixulma]